MTELTVICNGHCKLSEDLISNKTNERTSSPFYIHLHCMKIGLFLQNLFSFQCTYVLILILFQSFSKPGDFPFRLFLSEFRFSNGSRGQSRRAKMNRTLLESVVECFGVLEVSVFSNTGSLDVKDFRQWAHPGSFAATIAIIAVLI